MSEQEAGPEERQMVFVPDPSRTWFYRLVRRVVWLIMMAWLRPSTSGAGVVADEGAVLIAPVHRSNVDFAFAILATDRKLFFMAKDGLFKKGLARRFFLALGAFPVHRESADRSALVLAEAVLRAGEVLVLFPEGTRREGPRVEAILEGAGFLSARCEAPVLPLGIAGSDRVMPKGAWLPRPKKVHVVLGELIEPPARSEKGRVPRSAVHRHTEAIRAGIQAAYDEALAEEA
jgi:1-acyl-sn-glycerol-3-phosphate acyltransferase